MVAANTDIHDLLGVAKADSLWRRLRPFLLWGGLGLAVAGGVAWWWTARELAPTVHYQTIAAKTGNLTVTVSTTGTVQPINQVQVGSEISGRVDSVEVDYNARVTAGQVLASIDTDQLSAQTRHAEAVLNAAEADVANKQAALHLAQINEGRARTLALHQVASQQNLDDAQAALQQAQAALNAANAQVKVAQADLAADQTQLGKAVIKSPIDGIVLERNVDPGQTVAASLQAPVLFTIANDLTQMELLVDVDEADAGNVREGQTASFTVEAYPDTRFEAKVVQLRYDPVTVSGVVTYKSVMSVDNAKMLLRPGMTVAADIVTKQLQGALLAPNAALRYAPPTASAANRNFLDQMLRRGRNGSPTQTASPPLKPDEKRVWVVRDGNPVPKTVTVGSTDGSWTEIVSGDIRPGDQLISGTGGAR
jgi:HlyD family secretion protein